MPKSMKAFLQIFQLTMSFTILAAHLFTEVKKLLLKKFLLMKFRLKKFQNSLKTLKLSNPPNQTLLNPKVLMLTRSHHHQFIQNLHRVKHLLPLAYHRFLRNLRTIQLLQHHPFLLQNWTNHWLLPIQILIKSLQMQLILLLMKTLPAAKYLQVTGVIMQTPKKHGR